MRLLGIVPVNRLKDAKTRLAGVLPDRAPLALHLLRRVVGALRASECLEQVVVVSPDPRLELEAHACQVEFLSQQGHGLNPALEQVRSRFPGYDGLLVALGDLPALCPQEVREMVALLTGPGVVLAPDVQESGTNLLLCSPADALAFRFGPGSLLAHQQEAQRLGLVVRLYRSPGTALDLDTPEQLQELQWS